MKTMAKEKQQSVALAKADSFKVMTIKQNFEEIAEAIQENSQGKGISPADLPRISFPTGGAVKWSRTKINGEEIESEHLLAIPVFFVMKRSLWPSEYTGAVSQPVCVSNDGQRGQGDPGVFCRHCEFNQFGSKGRGKLCRENRDIYILFSESELPSILSVPPGSIGVFHNFLNQLSFEAIKFYHALIDFTIVSEKNRDGITFPKLHMTLAQHIKGEQAAVLTDYRKNFIKTLNYAGQVDDVNIELDDIGKHPAAQTQMESDIPY